jgi:hypothetical protein
MKKYCPCLSYYLLIVIFVSCVKTPNCELPLNVNQSAINIIFKDSVSGKYLYTEDYSLYNKDSIKIFDPQGTSLFLLFAHNQLPDAPVTFWIINFGNIYDQRTDEISFNNEICKDYIISYNSQESDTLKVCFKSKKTKCGSVFETLKVYYKMKLISTTKNNTGSTITILKN